MLDMECCILLLKLVNSSKSLVSIASDATDGRDKIFLMSFLP